MILDPTSARIGDLVAPRRSFMPSIDLGLAHDPDYRRLCRDEYIYLPEDEALWKHLANALLGQLAGGRRTIFEVGAYGAGKSLLDAVRGHLLADPGDGVLLDKLRRHTFLHERYEQLVSEGPYLPVFVVGSQAAGTPIDAVVIAATTRAVPPELSLVSDHDRAVEWMDGLADRDGLRAEFVAVVPHARPAPPAGGSWTVASLRLGLEEHHPAALSAFRDAQAAAVRWPTAAFGASRAVDVLRELHATHVGSGRRYAGIVLFFDEFSQWVDMLSDVDRAASIASVQGLVEWVNHSPRVAMVMSSQVRPALGDSHNALETLLTRTQEVPFDRRSYPSFLAHVLERRVDAFAPVDSQPAWPALEATHTKLFGTGGGSGPREYYPFHPGAVRALATLADQLGARERSVAQLIGATSDEEGGFGAFLESPVFETDSVQRRLRLFTLDRLFPYFAVRLRDDHPRLYERYEEIAGVHDGAEHLQTRIARVLVLSELLGPAFPVQPTSEGITELLHLPGTAAVDDVLGQLVADGLVIDAGDRGYRVGSAGRLSRSRLEHEIERRVHDLAATGDAASSNALVRRLGQADGWATEIWRRRHVRPPTPAMARSALAAIEFAAEIRITIELAIQRTTVGQLADLARRVADGRAPHSPTIFVVLASDSDTDAEALSGAVDRAQQIAAAGCAIGLPDRPARVSDLLTRLSAIEQLAAEEAFEGDELVEHSLLTARESLLKGLVTELDPAGFRWFIQDGAGATEERLTNLAAVADRLARVVGSHLPRGLRIDIGTNVKSDVASSLLLGGEIRLALDRTHKKGDQILHDGLAPIGVLEVEHRPSDPYRIARIIPPDREAHPQTREIWDLMVEAVEGRQTLATVVAALARPPFMLPRTLGAYLLAAVLGYTRAHVIADGGEPQRPQADQMRRLWDEPARYRFVAVRGLTREQALAIREIADVVAPEAHPTTRKALERREPDDGTIIALQSSAARWHARVGQKALALAQTVGITWPDPLAGWLTLAPQLAGAAPDAVPDLLLALAASTAVMTDGSNGLTVVAIQADALRDVMAEYELIVEAARSEDGPVAEAWQEFMLDPLAPEALSRIRATLAEAAPVPNGGGGETAAPTPGKPPETAGHGDRELTARDFRVLATELRQLSKAADHLTWADLVRRLAAVLGLDEVDL